jgi:hypothetical protein
LGIPRPRFSCVIHRRPSDVRAAGWWVGSVMAAIGRPARSPPDRVAELAHHSQIRLSTTLNGSPTAGPTLRRAVDWVFLVVAIVTAESDVSPHQRRVGAASAAVGSCWPGAPHCWYWAATPCSPSRS